MNFKNQFNMFINQDITKIRDQIVMRKELLKNQNFIEELVINIVTELSSKVNWDSTKEEIQILADLDYKILHNYNEYLEFIYDLINKKLSKLKYRINIWYIVLIETLHEIINPFEQVNKHKSELTKEITYRIYQLADKKHKGLNVNIEDFKDDEIGNPNYDLLFAFTLRQIPINEINQFFENNSKLSEDEYLNYIEYIMLDYDELFLEKTKIQVKQWVASKRETENKNQKEVKKHEKEAKSPKEIKAKKEEIKNALLDIKTASEYIKLAKSTIYGLTSKKEIPHYKKGKKIYFKKEELKKWLESGKRKSKMELNEEAEEYINRKKKFKKRGKFLIIF